MRNCLICGARIFDTVEYCQDCLRALTIYALQTGQSTEDAKQAVRDLKA